MNKISATELTALQENISKLNQVHIELGRLENQKHKILHQINEIESMFDELQKELEEKYGKVNINIENGEFTLIDENDEKNDDITLIKENEVVELLNVSKVTLNSWRKNNILKENVHYFRIGRSIRYKKEELLNFSNDE
jgi:predicted nuclease with TOPRIM domain